jgi:hypothetical protein
MKERMNTVDEARSLPLFLATAAANLIAIATAAWGFTPPGTHETRWMYVALASMPNLLLVEAAWITRHRIGRSSAVFAFSALALVMAAAVYPGIRVPSTDGQGNLGQVFAFALHVIGTAVMSVVGAALAGFTWRDDDVESGTDKAVFALLVLTLVATVLQGLLIVSNVFG